MTTPFEPADGIKGRARQLAELVESRQPGDEVTYAEAMELLDCELTQVQAAMNGARKILEDGKARSVRTVERFGWIVMDARANLDEVDRRRKRASRATTRAVRLLNATPRDELSQIERQRADFQSRQLVGARSLYDRTSKPFAELQKESKKAPELPFRKSDQAS